jgi:hypothetical protein
MTSLSGWRSAPNTDSRGVFVVVGHPGGLPLGPTAMCATRNTKWVAKWLRVRPPPNQEHHILP